MRRTFAIIGIAAILIAAVPILSAIGGVLRGVGPAILPPKEDIAEAINETDMPPVVSAVEPLSLPPGFSISVFARDLPGARVIVQDAAGNLWVSQPSRGQVTKIGMKDGAVQSQTAHMTGLRGPHGLAFDPGNAKTLYIAEETRIIRANIDDPASRQAIYQLPAGGRHSTRTILFGRDGRLYVTIGSTCDTCVEADPRHGSILSMKPDGSDVRTVATGLRNAVFFTNGPDGRIWATDMGRDFLGDNLPPDEVNVIDSSRGINPPVSFGWPFCYGKQVRDRTFRPNDSFACSNTEPSTVDLPAHVAPLGLAFIPRNWPAAMRGDLLVAEHGSWNSTQPVGYKVIRIPLDANGKPEGQSQDFVTGWLQGRSALGRPVDLFFGTDGSLYVTDDKAGVVYRVRAG